MEHMAFRIGHAHHTLKIETGSKIKTKTNIITIIIHHSLLHRSDRSVELELSKQTIKMNPVDDIQFLCRLCGSKTDVEERLDIFDNSGIYREIKLKISTCVNIDVREDDCLPKALCVDCVNNLENLYQFRIKSQNIDSMLRDLMNQHQSMSCQMHERDPLEITDADSILVRDPSSGHSESKVNVVSFDPTNINILPPQIQTTTSMFQLPGTVNQHINSISSAPFPSQAGSYFMLLDTSTPQPCPIVQNIPYNTPALPSHYTQSNGLVNIQPKITPANFVLQNPQYYNPYYLILQSNSSALGQQQCNIPLQYSNIVKNPAEIVNQMSTSQKYSNSSSGNLICRGRRRCNFPLPPYRCVLCPHKEFVSRKAISQHIKAHFTEKTLKCSYCDKKFAGQRALKVHIKLHEKCYDYLCNVCGKGFISKLHMEIHIRRAHTRELPFECSQCDKKFIDKSGLNIHFEKKHAEKRKESMCEICFARFASPHFVYIHKGKCHIPTTKRKIFKCNICHREFGMKHILAKHMLVHSGEANHECQVCKKRFVHKGGFQIHMLTHSGVRDFICDFCGHAFALKRNLDIHRLIHTGERKFKCKGCSKAFTQNSSLNRHYKSVCTDVLKSLRSKI